MGTLSDHVDSDAKTLRLSDDVAHARSIAALAVAAHEVAHAYQDVEGHRACRLRMRLGRPVMQVSQWSLVIFIGAFPSTEPSRAARHVRTRRCRAGRRPVRMTWNGTRRAPRA